MNRAYSTLEIKSMDDGRRAFAGIASTPNTDRMGDIVEPKGAQFKLPIPLLWQHDAHKPIGWVTSAKVTDKGIHIEGELAKVEEAGALKDRLDEAWQSLKAKLVRGLSIGFTGLEHSRLDSGGYRFLKWSWLELSAVTIPANADCSITAIKSADQAIRRAASGARPVVRLDNAPKGAFPGVSGPRRKGVVYLT